MIDRLLRTSIEVSGCMTTTNLSNALGCQFKNMTHKDSDTSSDKEYYKKKQTTITSHSIFSSSFIPKS